jgi:plastocyanin
VIKVANARRRVPLSRMVAAAAFAALLLLACSENVSSAACSPTGTKLHLVALNTHKFDTDCLAAPADERFTIELDNRDKSPHGTHNVSIIGGGETLFEGDGVPGGSATTYEVAPLQSGKYEFRCDLHPFMKGSFIVK